MTSDEHVSPDKKASEAEVSHEERQTSEQINPEQPRSTSSEELHQSTGDDRPADRPELPPDLDTVMVGDELLKPRRALSSKVAWVPFGTLLAELDGPADASSGETGPRGFRRVDFEQLGSVFDEAALRPSTWPEGEIKRRLSALIETKASLRPRMPVLSFRATEDGLTGPFVLGGEHGRASDARHEQANEENRHSQAGEVARELAETCGDKELRHEARAVLVLVDRAQVLRDEGRDRVECIARIERLLGSLYVKLLRPQAEQSERLNKRLRAGANESNRQRAAAAAASKAAVIELIVRHLRERPKMSNRAIAAWLRRDRLSSLSLSTLRQLAAKLRRNMA